MDALVAIVLGLAPAALVAWIVWLEHKDGRR